MDDTPRQDESSPPARSRRWWLRRTFVVPVLTLALVILAPVVYRQWLLSRVPDIGDPFPVAEVLQPIPVEENAFPLFEEAYALLVEPSETEARELMRQQLDGWKPEHALLNEYLELNRPALEKWREAAEKSDRQFVPIEEIVFATSPALDSRRAMIRWCQTEIERLTKSGGPVEALPWLRASFRGSALGTRNSDWLFHWIGTDFVAISSSSTELWMEHPELQADELLDLLATVQDSARLLEKPSTVVRVGYVVAGRYADAEPRTAQPFASDWRAWLRAEPESSRRLRVHVTANHLAFVDLPRRERPPLLDGEVFDESAVGATPTGRLPAHELLEHIERSRVPGRKSLFGGLLEGVDRVEARCACLQVALAAQAYYRDHGEFPGRVADLQPHYLAQLPDDPYAPRPAPVIYRRGADEAIVYSRYQNGLDNGGAVLTYEEAGKREPPDFGIRIRPPGDRPAVARRP